MRRPLAREDIDALIASQPSLRGQAALLLLAYIGLRKDEFRRLQVGAIDLEAGTITIRGKGGHVDTLPLGFEHVQTALALHFRERQPTADEIPAPSAPGSR